MPSSQGSNSDITSKINAYQALAHLPRTMKVAGATMRDERVSIAPKIFFVASIIFVAAALVFPDALVELPALIPGIGPLLGAIGIPIDGALDWVTIGIVALNMMKLFPQHIVNEHFDEVVAKGKPTGPIVDADPAR